MSQQDNFSGGFVLGAIVGGVLGGVLGVVLATPKAPNSSADANPTGSSDELKATKPRRRPLRGMAEPMTEQSMEVARQGLEAKIAQLNDAIDDVQQQISSVNGRSAEIRSEKFPS